MATAGSRLHRFWYGAATAAVAIDAMTIMLLENSMMTDWLPKFWGGGRVTERVEVGPVYIPEYGA